jgi:hypothetical protein
MKEILLEYSEWHALNQSIHKTVSLNPIILFSPPRNWKSFPVAGNEGRR